MSTTTRILLCLIGGLLVGAGIGAYAPDLAATVATVAEPVGGLWLSALRMTIIPLIFSLIVVEIIGAADAADAGGVTARALLTIVVLMTVSAATAAIATPLILEIFPVADAAADALKAGAGAAGAVPEAPPILSLITGIIPTNPINAATNGEILPLVVFALAFGFAITRLKADDRAPLAKVFRATTDALLVIIGWALWIAPVGVFALAVMLGARTGLGAAGTLVHYMATISFICILMGVIAYPLAVIVGRTAPMRFVRAVAPSQAMALSTQSSLACLPPMIKAATGGLGIPERIAGLVLPLAVSLLRFTGPAANLAVALYVAHLYGIAIGPLQMAGAVAIAVITSMGAVSLPGQISFFTSIAPICLFLGVPVEILPLLIAVETIPDLWRTWGNVTADVALTAMVARGKRDEAAVEAA